MRKAEVKRQTKETDITLEINLDGRGIAEVESGNGFFDHMLTLLCGHSKIDMKLICIGDIAVDFHHSAEDIGIALGLAIKTALGDKRGIVRYGDIILPMDEALILCSMDFSGRGYLNYKVETRATTIVDKSEDKVSITNLFDTELSEEFFCALTRNADMTLHIKKLDGTNTHHIIEGVFKAFGRALRRAISFDKDFLDEIPSTKGKL
ncbi:imidazoleglycerol-phosphate dehydratase HisB [bacterium]|nr:imidazoleglycerol-phosphate dehydratase HisB [bacterium]